MIVIRRAQLPRDASVLTGLQYLCLPYDEPMTYRESDAWWIAYEDGAPVAFAGIRRTRAQESVWYLCRAGVLPSARGQGLQRRLIAKRVAWARAQGAAAVVTDCTPTNYASANSLIRAGFKLYRPGYAWAMPHSMYWKLSCSKP